jgi:streptolysin S family bacteriocin protoxin
MVMSCQWRTHAAAHPEPSVGRRQPPLDSPFDLRDVRVLLSTSPEKQHTQHPAHPQPAAAAMTMPRLLKFLGGLQQPPEQPIEPELKTTANKERDREIKCVRVVDCCCCCCLACRSQQRVSVGTDDAPTATATTAQQGAAGP